MAQRTEFTNLFLKILLIPSSVLDPDSGVFWARIRIRNLDPGA